MPNEMKIVNYSSRFDMFRRYWSNFYKAFNGEPIVPSLIGKNLKVEPSQLISLGALHSYVVRNFLITKPDNSDEADLINIYISEGDLVVQRDSDITLLIERIPFTSLDDVVHKIFQIYYDTQNRLINHDVVEMDIKLVKEIATVRSAEEQKKIDDQIAAEKKSTEEQIAALKIELANKNALCESKLPEVKALGDQFYALKAQVKQLENEIETLNTLAESKAYSEAEEADLIAGLEPQPTIITHAPFQHDKMRELEQLKAKFQQVSEAFKKIQAEVLEGGHRLTDLRKRMSDLTKLLDSYVASKSVDLKKETYKIVRAAKIKQNVEDVTLALKQHITQLQVWGWIEDIVKDIDVNKVIAERKQEDAKAVAERKQADKKADKTNIQAQLTEYFKDYIAAPDLETEKLMSLTDYILRHSPVGGLFEKSHDSKSRSIIRYYLKESVAWKKTNPTEPFHWEYICPLTQYGRGRGDKDKTGAQQTTRLSRPNTPLPVAAGIKVPATPRQVAAEMKTLASTTPEKVKQHGTPRSEVRIVSQSPQNPRRSSVSYVALNARRQSTQQQPLILAPLYPASAAVPVPATPEMVQPLSTPIPELKLGSPSLQDPRRSSGSFVHVSPNAKPQSGRQPLFTLALPASEARPVTPEIKRGQLPKLPQVDAQFVAARSVTPLAFETQRVDSHLPPPSPSLLAKSSGSKNTGAKSLFGIEKNHNQKAKKPTFENVSTRNPLRYISGAFDGFVEGCFRLCSLTRPSKYILGFFVVGTLAIGAGCLNLAVDAISLGCRLAKLAYQFGSKCCTTGCKKKPKMVYTEDKAAQKEKVKLASKNNMTPKLGAQDGIGALKPGPRSASSTSQVAALPGDFSPSSTLRASSRLSTPPAQVSQDIQGARVGVAVTPISPVSEDRLNIRSRQKLREALRQSQERRPATAKPALAPIPQESESAMPLPGLVIDVDAIPISDGSHEPQKLQDAPPAQPSFFRLKRKRQDNTPTGGHFRDGSTVFTF